MGGMGSLMGLSIGERVAVDIGEAVTRAAVDHTVHDLKTRLLTTAGMARSLVTHQVADSADPLKAMRTAATVGSRLATQLAVARDRHIITSAVAKGC